MPLMINSNIASLNAQRQLTSTGMDLDKASERLASGLRINSAADDAAGLAIANRQTSQIRGLDQAIRNANDGISLIQTAEGALDETTNILQRMRELSIQASNGIYSDTDRATLDAEVQQLKEEIDRIAETTSFNGQNILDGTLGQISLQVGSEANETINLQVGTLDAENLGGGLSGDIVGAEMAASTTAAVEFSAIGDLVTGDSTTISINGQSVGDLSNAASLQDILDGFNNNVSGVQTSSFFEAAASTSADGILTGTQSVTIVMEDLESDDQTYVISNTGSMDELIAQINTVTGGTIQASLNDDGFLQLSSQTAAAVLITDASGATGFATGEEHRAKLTLEITDSSVDDIQIALAGSDTIQTQLLALNLGLQERGTDTTAADITGDRITAVSTAITQGDLVVNGIAMSGIAGDAAESTQAAQIATMLNAKSDESGVVATVSTVGTDSIMVLNSVSGKEISIEFAGTTATWEGTGLVQTNLSATAGDSISGLSLSTIGGAQSAINVIDVALEQINSVRSDLGAVNNRLDFTVSNLANVSENTSAARSRVMDADFAAETAALSRAQVLQQASQAMLAQANARPQQVLSLLN